MAGVSISRSSATFFLKINKEFRGSSFEENISDETEYQSIARYHAQLIKQLQEVALQMKIHHHQEEAAHMEEIIEAIMFADIADPLVQCDICTETTHLMTKIH